MSQRLLACTAVVFGAAIVQVQVPPARPMSFHNRVLLNRAAVTGVNTLEVMLATTPGRLEAASAAVERVLGTVKYGAAAVGYLRADVPTNSLTALVGDASIDAYQISWRSRAAWLRDGVPRPNAEMFRGFETSAPAAPDPSPPKHGLPALSAVASRQPGYTADEDVGLRRWTEEHPTFDGRGVTIALLESGLPEFTHPTIRTAKTLDGREIPKLAGILNTIADDHVDESRVQLDVEIKSVSAWHRIESRTYIMPRTGHFRFGRFRLLAGANLVHEFGVLRDDTSGEIWVDANGNADFSDEAPVSDVNMRFDPRHLKLIHPRPLEVAFVVAQGRHPNVVHIYHSGSSHQAMTLSVVAGSASEDALTAGVAPAARILLIRSNSTDYSLRDIVEGFIAALARPDVDMLSDSQGIGMAPDTAADFMGLILRRMVAAYGKPVFHSAGNNRLMLNEVSALGDVFSVGGSISAQTFAALYGGGTIDGLMVHPYSAAGPAVDGALKPDFLAPVHRIAADLWTRSSDVRLPRNAPTMYLPSGYQISCCTSASGPFAAGIGALLLSAAKQQGILYSVTSLGRALRVGARFLPHSPAHEQGNGVLDVNAAWRELQRTLEIPRIRTEGPIVHPLVPYAARGSVGEGLYERDGWTAGMTGVREMRFYRESGPRDPVTYRVGWVGNDGTFAARQSVTLPLGTWVSLPIHIAVKTPGAHSSILSLHDAVTGDALLRTMTTIVAAYPIRDLGRPLRLAGTVPVMGSEAHYVAIPGDVELLDIDLEVIRGSLDVGVLPSHGLYGPYYWHAYPGYGRTFAKGTHRLAMPRPAAGTWSVYVGNTSAFDERNQALISHEAAEYVIRIRILSASLRPRRLQSGAIAVDLENLGAEIREPIVQTSTGTRRSYRGDYLPNGMPNLFDIDVPEGAEALVLQARALDATRLELYLYECTSGECFSYDYTVPAVTARTFVVRRPRAGRWKVAVNAAPFPRQAGTFVLDEIITAGVERRTVARGPRPPGATWSETFFAAGSEPSAPPPRKDSHRVILVELLDNAVERETNALPWDDGTISREYVGKGGVIGTAVHPLD